LDERSHLDEDGVVQCAQRLEPTPIADEDALLLNISAEEAKSRNSAFRSTIGTFDGGIIGAQYRERDLFGYGRPVHSVAEVFAAWLQKATVVTKDPFLFDTDFSFKKIGRRFTFDYDGYSNSNRRPGRAQPVSSRNNTSGFVFWPAPRRRHADLDR